MEEDQKLFDLCTQNYNKQRSTEGSAEEEREARWKKLEEQAKNNPQVIFKI